MSSSTTVVPKSAPVLLPNAKKPSLLMRLFSTERKSTVYVMPTTTVANEDGAVESGAVGTAAATARQQRRQMKRLQSVDSATMQRDREAMLKERCKQNIQQRDGNPATNHKSAPDDSHQDPPSSRHSVDGTGSGSIQIRPSSAIEGKTGSGSDSGRRKLSAQSGGMRIQLTKDSTTSTPTATSDVSPTGDKMAMSPTRSAGRSLPSSPESLGTETHSPVSSGSPSVKQSNQTLGSKSGAKRSPDVETIKPPLSPTAPPIQSENGNNVLVKRDTTSNKRPSISVTNSAPSDGGGAGGAGNQRRAKSAGSAVKSRNGNRKLKHRKKRAPQQSGEIKVDTSKPLEFPTTPDIISEYHRQKPFLNHNEEWLIVELLEYECLVDGMEIIKTVAKHSKFFEVEPDELWEEFFEFVENVPSYDEIINYDVWQEFLLEKYNC